VKEYKLVSAPLVLIERGANVVGAASVSRAIEEAVTALD
jgi:hypothetical protein